MVCSESWFTPSFWFTLFPHSEVTSCSGICANLLALLPALNGFDPLLTRLYRSHPMAVIPNLTSVAHMMVANRNSTCVDQSRIWWQPIGTPSYIVFVIPYLMSHSNPHLTLIMSVGRVSDKPFKSPTWHCICWSHIKIAVIQNPSGSVFIRLQKMHWSSGAIWKSFVFAEIDPGSCGARSSQFARINAILFWAKNTSNAE